MFIGLFVKRHRKGSDFFFISFMPTSLNQKKKKNVCLFFFQVGDILLIQGVLVIGVCVSKDSQFNDCI